MMPLPTWSLTPAGHPRLTGRYLCTVPKITAILDVAGFDLEKFVARGGTIAKREGEIGVWITPVAASSWDQKDRQKAIVALFRLGLHVHVLPYGTSARAGRGGWVQLHVVPGGWMGD